jgi:hypothetical protein
LAAENTAEEALIIFSLCKPQVLYGQYEAIALTSEEKKVEAGN